MTDWARLALRGGPGVKLVDFSSLPPQEPECEDGWMVAWCRKCNHARWKLDLAAVDDATYWGYLAKLVCSRHWEPYLIMFDAGDVSGFVDDQQTFT